VLSIPGGVSELASSAYISQAITDTRLFADLAAQRLAADAPVLLDVEAPSSSPSH
jgi:hypothetical protein